eukprot:5041169-Amphidinium_carterae.1
MIQKFKLSRSSLLGTMLCNAVWCPCSDQRLLGTLLACGKLTGGQLASAVQDSAEGNVLSHARVACWIHNTDLTVATSKHSLLLLAHVPEKDRNESIWLAWLGRISDRIVSGQGTDTVILNALTVFYANQ